MTEKMQMIIILFLFAFLIGFFLAHLLRKKAYETKFQNKIAQLEEENKQEAALYAQALEKSNLFQKEYEKVHQHFIDKKTELEALSRQEAEILQQITALEEEARELHERIETSDTTIAALEEEVQRLEKELEAIRNLRNAIEQTETQSLETETKLGDTKALLESYHNDIAMLKEERKKLREQNKQLHETVHEKKYALKDLQNALEAIDKKYRKPLQAHQQNVEDLKISALNYEYALKSYREQDMNISQQTKSGVLRKLFVLPDTLDREISAFVHKTDRNRWIDKLFKRRTVTDKEL